MEILFTIVLLGALGFGVYKLVTRDRGPTGTNLGGGTQPSEPGEQHEFEFEREISRPSPHR